MGRTLEQLLIDEKPDVVAEAQAIAKDILLNIHLAELREKVAEDPGRNGAGFRHKTAYRCRNGKTGPRPEALYP